MRLIDADAIIPKCTRITPDNVDLATVIRFAPTVDAVQVVRCSWCKHWKKDVAGCTENVGRCEYANYFVGASGYCVYGERKEGAE